MASNPADAAESAPDAVAIGWDVRGWQSREQAMAVAALTDGDIHWLGRAAAFRFQAGAPLGLSSLLATLDSDVAGAIKRARRVVVAIDAPLAFPRTFVDLLRDDVVPAPVSAEIENPLAYRDCDRWIFRTHGKKPLSASFDRLGNPATLAISIARALRPDGFSTIPQQETTADRAVIEVYPGIHKAGAKRTDPAVAPIAALLPGDVDPATDLYDASICALLGILFAGSDGLAGLPALVGPPPGRRTDEGWIYALPAEFLSEHR